MLNYIQVKHTTEGDVLGQTLTFEKRDQWLLEYHSQMKNAINNPAVIGLDVVVLDNQLHQVFSDSWVREIEVVQDVTPEETEGE